MKNSCFMIEFLNNLITCYNYLKKIFLLNITKIDTNNLNIKIGEMSMHD